MNKLFTLIAVLLGTLTSFGQNTQVAHWGFDTQEEFDQWTVFNTNNDSYAWSWYQTSGRSTASIRWSNDVNMDDWLISPAVTVTKDGYYKMTMLYQAGGSSHESMDIYTGASNTIEGMTSLVKSYPDLTGNGYRTMSVFVPLKANTPTYIGFHGKSIPGQWRIILDDIILEESSGCDIQVTNILSPVDGKNLTTADVKIKIANNGNIAVNNFPVAYSINGGTAVNENCTSTLNPGDSISYTFATKADISTTRKEYLVKAWTALELDDIKDNDSIATTVYNAGVATVPYSMGFEKSEVTSTIKFYNLNDDTGNWSIDQTPGFFNMARTGSGYMMYDYDRNNVGDDWAILESIKVEPGYYSLKFWYSSVNDHNERLAVFYGNGDTPADMKNKIIEYSPFNINEYVESATVVHITEPQEINIGFHAFSDKNENVILIDDISFEKIEATDISLSINNIVSPEDYVRSQNNELIKFSVTNNGISNVDNSTLKVSIDNSNIITETLAIPAQSTATKSISNVLSTLTPGKHTLKIEVLNQQNFELSKDFVVVGEPVKLWDFEDYTMSGDTKVFTRPAEFTYLNKDGGTLNAQVKDYFPDELGWGPIEIEKHKTLGECMLGVTSYIDNVTKADRWCVLPKMHIGSGDASLVWSANSIDANYPETYKIMVSESPIENDDFSTLATINNEPTAITTHGVDLSSYEGKDIYVAFRLVSRSAFIMTLDNIGFYGAVSSSAPNVGTDDNNVNVVIDNSTLTVTSNEVANISIADMSGRTIASINDSNEMNISNIQSGIYVAIIKTANGTITRKFVKK